MRCKRLGRSHVHQRRDVPNTSAMLLAMLPGAGTTFKASQASSVNEAARNVTDALENIFIFPSLSIRPSAGDATKDTPDSCAVLPYVRHCADINTRREAVPRKCAVNIVHSCLLFLCGRTFRTQLYYTALVGIKCLRQHPAKLRGWCGPWDASSGGGGFLRHRQSRPSFGFEAPARPTTLIEHVEFREQVFVMVLKPRRLRIRVD